MKKLLLSLVAMVAATTLSAQKVLVLYYSETGTTKTVALEMQKQLGADLEAIEAVEPYTGNFQETMQRGQREMKSGQTPALKPLKKKIADYDIIFLGYPIWFGTYAMPIATLVKQQSFAGKKVVPFCTFGSGGLNTSTEALKKALPKAQIQTGYGVRTARVAAAPKEIDRFLKENGYKKGTVKKLPPLFGTKACDQRGESHLRYRLLQLSVSPRHTLDSRQAHHARRHRLQVHRQEWRRVHHHLRYRRERGWCQA